MKKIISVVLTLTFLSSTIFANPPPTKAVVDEAYSVSNIYYSLGILERRLQTKKQMIDTILGGGMPAPTKADRRRDRTYAVGGVALTVAGFSSFLIRSKNKYDGFAGFVRMMAASSAVFGGFVLTGRSLLDWQKINDTKKEFLYYMNLPHAELLETNARIVKELQLVKSQKQQIENTFLN